MFGILTGVVFREEALGADEPVAQAA